MLRPVWKKNQSLRSYFEPVVSMLVRGHLM